MFIDYLLEQMLSEMPHMVLPSGTAIDLELEKFSKDTDDFLRHLSQILSGEAFKTKYGTTVRLDKEESDFIKKKLAADGGFFIPFVKKFHTAKYHTVMQLLR